MDTIALQEGFSLRGELKIYLTDLKTAADFRLHDEIVKRMKAGLPFMELVRELNKMAKAKIFEIKNLNPTVGRTMIMNNLTSPSPTDVMLANYTALGTGVTAPANGDTTLQTETFRKVVASRTNSLNVGYITAFYSAPETSGTFREAGIFSNGTGAANSGVLVVRAAINITKTIIQTLTIDHILTLN